MRFFGQGLALLLPLAGASGGGGFPPEPEVPRQRRAKPNILLLLTDDQDVLLGGTSHMPLLRHRLIENGVTFRNAFVHTPICCPSRSSILSGRYIHNGGALNNSLEGNCYGKEWREDAERETFAVRAKESGYRTSYAGKYLNRYPEGEEEGGGNNVPPGWDKWMGLVGNSRYYDYEVILSDDGGNSTARVHHGRDYHQDYLPDLVANRTLETMDQFSKDDPDTPFLAVVAWPTPHGPFTPAPWADKLYDGLRAPRTENWNASSRHMMDKHWLMRQLAPIDPDTEKFIDATYQSRAEALRSVDEHIGRFFHLLEETEALENTVVMYTSDNGFQLGQHRLRVDKRQLYEYDIRVPFFAYSPFVSPGAIVDDIVLNIDIAPTIVELATGSSSPRPDDMDGISFAPYLMGRPGDRIRREDFLVSYHGEGDPACGMAECPPAPPGTWHGGWEPDSYNNTYRCVRTIVVGPSSSRTTESKKVEDEDVVASGYYGDIAAAAAPSRRRAASAEPSSPGVGVEGIHKMEEDGVRSEEENTVYCRFDDDERFGEYYDLNVDEWELTNAYKALSDVDRSRYEARLAELGRCRGESCRTPRPPSPKQRAHRDQQETNSRAGRRLRPEEKGAETR